MKTIASLVALLAAFAARADEPRSFAVTLEPGAMHEECATLAAGEKRSYYWKAAAPVDFNIHFHEGEKVSYPVKREAMRGDGGTFVAKVAQDYCWMWTARDKPAKVEGKVDSK
jgi:hypothetical protein